TARQGARIDRASVPAPSGIRRRVPARRSDDEPPRARGSGRGRAEAGGRKGSEAAGSALPARPAGRVPFPPRRGARTDARRTGHQSGARHGLLLDRRHLFAAGEVGRGDRRAPAVDLDQSLLQRSLHPAGQGVLEDLAAGRGRGHAAARHPVRPEQQDRALSAGAAAAADGARRGGAEGVRDRRAAPGRHQVARARACAAAALLLTPRSEGWPVSLVDVAPQAGLRATSVYGGVDRKRFIIETNGAGVAFFDYDNDGWTDALVLNGVRLKEGTREIERYAPGSEPVAHLYHNE